MIVDKISGPLGAGGKKYSAKISRFQRGLVVAMILLLAVVSISVYTAGKTKTSVRLQLGKRNVTGKTCRMNQGAKKKLKVVSSSKITSVRFRSSDKRVASVNKKGVVYAKKAGTAKITAVVKIKRGTVAVWTKVKVMSSGKNKKADTTVGPAGTERPSLEPVSPAPSGTATPIVIPTPVPTPVPVPATEPPDGDGEKILIAYFTRSGNTQTLADIIQDKTGGTKFKIETVKAYPEDYNGVLAEALKEKEENARPELKTRVDNMSDYDTVFIGYPIWHGDTPMAVRSFLESYDFTGKKVIPFCSSGSSAPQTSYNSVSEAVPGAHVLEGFWTRGADVGNAANDVNRWIDGLGVVGENKEGETLQSQIHITAGDTVFTATLADNSSADALKNILLQGPLTINMSDYANMEKVGPIGTSLPRNDEHIETEAGDLILYQGNSFVVYYGTNTWNFTRLGKIDGVTKEQLFAALGSGM